MVNVYIIKCSNEKYYVGKTTRNVFERYSEHCHGSGSYWTKKYKPICLEEYFENCDEFDEDKYTKKYMKKYGIANVRGGRYAQMKLSDDVLKHLEDEISATDDKCYKCGKAGHFQRKCNNTGERVNDDTPDRLLFNPVMSGYNNDIVFESQFATRQTLGDITREASFALGSTNNIFKPVDKKFYFYNDNTIGFNIVIFVNAVSRGIVKNAMWQINGVLTDNQWRYTADLNGDIIYGFALRVANVSAQGTNGAHAQVQYTAQEPVVLTCTGKTWSPRSNLYSSIPPATTSTSETVEAANVEVVPMPIVETSEMLSGFEITCYFENTEKHCGKCDKKHDYDEWYGIFKDFLPMKMSFDQFKKQCVRMIRNFKVNKRCYCCGGYECERGSCENIELVNDLYKFDKDMLELIILLHAENSLEDIGHNECCICLQEYDTNEMLLKTECGHCFHAECIDLWLDQAPECPVCRRYINENHMIQLIWIGGESNGQ